MRIGDSQFECQVDINPFVRSKPNVFSPRGAQDGCRHPSLTWATEDVARILKPNN